MKPSYVYLFFYLLFLYLNLMFSIRYYKISFECFVSVIITYISKSIWFSLRWLNKKYGPNLLYYIHPKFGVKAIELTKNHQSNSMPFLYLFFIFFFWKFIIFPFFGPLQFKTTHVWCEFYTSWTQIAFILNWRATLICTPNRNHF